MRISWNWLREYADAGITPQEAAAVLTSTGLEVERVERHEPVKGMLEGVVVGHVLACGRHPDADRLSLCDVDLGDGEPVRIVCGAPNVAAGQKVLVATVGSTLHAADGTSVTIRRSRIRGQESHGMICAEDELGLGHGHEGIMVLDPSAVAGTPAARHFGLTADHVLEIGLTPNRTDAMGHVGVARDLIAALCHRNGATASLRLPSVEAYAQDDEALSIKVEVQAPEACPRYAGVTLTGVKVGPSPDWLRDRLLAIGLKPINNVVDVTNYVQHELGQPLHAFDAARLEGGRIVVRMAAAGEPFVTLDGKRRELDAGDLVIADAQGPVCIAGVFGGLHSGVTEGTTAVFLESACFDPAHIRRTARRHGLNTDASFRFERGVDPEAAVYALKRAALLLKEVAGARISSGITDIGNLPEHAREVRLRFADIGHLTGLRIGPDDAVRILELLDFRVLERDAHGARVLVPPYRRDVHRPADVIEEILRIHGYDRVPSPPHLMCPTKPLGAPGLERFRERTAAHLAARGMREIMTPSLVSGERCRAIGIAGTEGLVALANPLSSELDTLRPTMLFGALRAIAHNINRQRRDLRFFEHGRTYRRDGGRTTEAETLSLAITGRRWRERWRSGGRRSEPADVREELECLLERLGLGGSVEWEPMEHGALARAHALRVAGRHAGTVGEVPEDQLERDGIGQPVHFAEIWDEALLEAQRAGDVVYEELPRFPSVRRDLSLLLDAGTRFARLRRIAFNAERKLLREVDLFDVYQGDGLPPGRKSYALSLILQDEGRTLTDEQVDKAVARIRQALEKEAGAELRG